MKKAPKNWLFALISLLICIVGIILLEEIAKELVNNEVIITNKFIHSIGIVVTTAGATLFILSIIFHNKIK